MSRARAPASGWRPSSVPEQLALLGLACVPFAFVWPSLHAATGLELTCPLRRFTGVPCPLCGMTSAATALVEGDLGGSLAANPFLLVLALSTLAMTGVMVGRAAGRLPPPARLGPATERLALLVVGAGVAVSWAVQLHRFGWL